MKKTLLLEILGMAAISAFGQSVIWLDNYNSFGGPIVTYGANVPANGVSGALGPVCGGLNSSWTAGIYFVVGTPSITDPAGTGMPDAALSLGTGPGSTAQFDSPSTFNTPGCFSSVQEFNAEGPVGSTVTVELVVYDTAGGSYANAAYRAHSAPFTMTTDSTTPSTVGDAMLAAGINGLSLSRNPNGQFNYVTNNSMVTITGYNVCGRAVTIPSTIDGLPVGTIGDYAFEGSDVVSVTIPDSVTNIGNSAFYSCTSLTGVTIGTNVTSIGTNAFDKCTSLTSITIPNGVTSIGDHTFCDCTSLANFIIPNSVTNIGDSAFEFCGNLTSVTIGKSVTSIGTNALAYCGLTDITIPDSVTSIGGSAFENCLILTSVTIGNSVISIGDGAFAACYHLASLTIGNSVTSIGDYAFTSCFDLASVAIPNSVTNIGNSAFLECEGLTSVTIPNSVTSIESYAFDYCISLTNIIIPNSVTNIGNSAFRQCEGLTSVTIPNSVTSIESYAFDHCISLTNIIIPSSVTSIGTDAFGYCNSLTVDALNPVYSSVDGVLFNKSRTVLMEYVAGIAPNSYTIPDSVTSIGGEAFWYCTNLTNVTIPNTVTSIGDYAFAGCASLTSVTIPNSVISIGDGAFEYCASLSGITIGDGVTSIGSGALFNCTSLTNVTIPNTATSIGDYAFRQCGGLTSVYFKGNAPSTDATVFLGDNNATVYYLPGTTGWGPTFGGRPTALWIEVPTIQTSPQTQTAEAGSAVGLWACATNSLPLFYLWYFNDTNFLSYSTNNDLELTNLQFSQSGAYTVVFSNVLGAATSAPAMLNVIPAVERRPVPGIKVAGDAASLLNLDYADSLSPAPNWKTLATITLSNPSQFYFDLTTPLPPQTFYRARQPGTPSVSPSLKLAGMVPAITLTGNVRDTLRLDYINQFGPTDAWVTLDTITLTNTSQLYFDVSVIGQPPRLYQIVPVP